MNSFKSALTRAQFGPDFQWGVVISSFQNEGAHDIDGKGRSIWDEFSSRKGKIKDKSHAQQACEFYYRYTDDILLAKRMGFNVFRFSIAWARIMPKGTGEINAAGIDFYNRVIDTCLAYGLAPCVTLYHWDLPHSLQQKGGWAHRGIVFAFEEYVRVCAQAFGDRVKQWIVVNEPFGFTSLGYMLGVHAPGKFGLSYFLPAVHHVALAQAEGGRVLRSEVKDAKIGTALSCSHIIPFTNNENDEKARRKADALFNRLFIEPALGMGYPVDAFPLLGRIERRYAMWRDWDKLAFDFDFIGLQNYFPLVVKHNPFMPIIGISEVKPKARNVPTTALGWEISGDGMYQVIKQFAAYAGVKELVVTESGAAFPDLLHEDAVDDHDRIQYFQEYLQGALKAKEEGINLTGYYVWTLTDNFEWAEGYKAKFGLVHVDFTTQQRTLKSSGKWFTHFLHAK
ncbi:beta-glucosidase [Chitinophaga skermanii]|uniref:Beta-glucosidase n=1 Tax=Chitinophaga skermanii TaxID=331697 RepID=A0A327QLK4_9BACT|nr:GH1 family beta-glucosidase [Chitinophaga skermanii]RAJ02637.1 beta-glucosidase [Chitinophaga skermanii]